MTGGDRPTRRALRLLALVALVGAAHVAFLAFVELDRTVRHRAAIAALEADLEAARAEARELRAIAEREDDVTFREQLARLQGFVGPSETRVVVLNEP
ncbi:MAG: septum formation initiator [Deinococcus-Thermus bacterium]|nr:septum formation initiator [Deinococcota bacterium]